MAMIIQDGGKMQRDTRTPEYSFQLRTQRPYEIRPFLCAPVLMRETMKHLSWKSVTHTDALASRNLGAWLEQHFYYVKLRDLEERDDIAPFILNQATDLSSLNRAASNYTYHAGSGVDWLFACYKRIVDEYWRHDGEVYNTAGTTDATTGMSLAKIHSAPHRCGIMDSMVSESDLDTAMPSIPSGEMTDLQQAWIAYQAALSNAMVEMTFEDYLALGGVRVRKDESHIPELIGFRKQWTLPSTGMDQSSGTTQSVWFWQMEGEQRKRFIFEEPGFIVGIQCIRPKVYLKNQSSSQIALLTEFVRWLPPQLKGMHGASLDLLDAHAEPFNALDVAGNNTKGVWFDIMDLFQYGDQFVDFDMTLEGDGLHALPANDMTPRWYPSEADMQALFNGAAYECYTEGVARVAIASSTITRDQTPGLLRMGQPMGLPMSPFQPPVG